MNRLIDAYLDRQLSPDETVAFERRMEQDTTLGRAVQRQRAIDARLCALISPPAPDAICEKLRSRQQSRSSQSALRGGWSRRQRLAAAALLALTVAGAWQIWRTVSPPRLPDIYAPQLWRSMETVFADTLAADFKPDWVCKDDEEFASAYGQRFNQPMLLAQAPPGVRAVGLSYSNTISPTTMYLLAEVHGQRVLIFADRARADRGQVEQPTGPFNLFRRQVDRVVLYELTPFDQPHLLDLFYVP